MRGKNKKKHTSRNLSLKDLIDLSEWQKIQDNFSAVTGVGLRLVDSEGHPLTSPSKEPYLCSQILKKYPAREKICGSCSPTFLGGKGIVDRNLSFLCHAGLHNFVTPLRLDGSKVLGYLIVGPVILVMRKTKEEYNVTAQELGIDADEFWSAILEIKVVSFHGAQSLMELIKDLGEYTVKLAYQNKIKEREIFMATGSHKLVRFLDALLAVACEISQAEIGSVMFFDKDSDELTIHASRGLSDEIVRNTKVRLGEGIAGLAAKEGKYFLIDNTIQDMRIRPLLKRPYISSSMVIPLRMENKIIGVMNIGARSTSSVRFTKKNINLMKRLVDLAALAINN
jgi:ligand-binding sensor protein